MIFVDESGAWNIVCIVSLAFLNVVDKDAHIVHVMLLQQILPIHQVSLHLWVFYVQDFIVELLKLSIGHFWSI